MTKGTRPPGTAAAATDRTSRDSFRKVRCLMAKCGGEFRWRIPADREGVFAE